MKTAERYFYDVPVYRVAEGRYLEELIRHTEKVLFPADDPLSRRGKAAAKEGVS